MRPEAVRAAGETGSDTKVTEERLGIKMPSWSKRSRDARVSDSLVRDLSPRCTTPDQGNHSDDCKSGACKLDRVPTRLRSAAQSNPH